MDDICDLVQEYISIQSFSASQYISTENLIPNRGGVQPSLEYPTTAIGLRYKPGDILISNIRPYLKKIWLASHNGACSTDIIVLRSRGEVSSQLLYHLLSRDNFFTYVMNNAVGTKMPRGDKQIIRLYPVAFPCDKRQQEIIIKILSSVDKKILLTRKTLEKYESIKKATVNLLLKPKADWVCIKLGDIGDVAMCKRILKSQTTSFSDVPFYKIGTFGKRPDAFISRSLFEDYKQRFSYPKVGDVLLSAAGTIGRTVVFNGEVSYFQDSNIVWIVNNERIVSNKYLNVIYSQLEWQTENGGTVSRLYNANILNTAITIPHLEEQKRIVASLDSIDNTITTLKEKLKKTQNLKQSMLQYFFG